MWAFCSGQEWEKLDSGWDINENETKQYFQCVYETVVVNGTLRSRKTFNIREQVEPATLCFAKLKAWEYGIKEDNSLTTSFATVKQKTSLAHDTLGSAGYRYYRALSQQNHNDADSPTVTPAVDYPAAKVPPVNAASHWLTRGLSLYESLLPDISPRCVLLRKPGAAARPLSRSRTESPSRARTPAPCLFILTVLPLVPPHMSMLSKDTD